VPLPSGATGRYHRDPGVVLDESRIEALERENARLRAELEARDHAPFGEGLREREALLSEAERIVHLGCWMWDTASGAIRWSDELYRIFGVAPTITPTPETFFTGVHPDDVERVREGSARALATRVTEPFDFRVVRPDGTERNVHMEAAIVPSGDSLRLVGTVLDVTERLAIESRLRASQKMEAIGTLAGGIAHDFNNYLQVIFSSLDIIAAPDTSERDRARSLAQIREAADRSQRLTRQLLLFSRPRFSEPEVVSLDELLDRTAPMLGTLLGDSIRLRRVRAASDIRVAVDPIALEQVVLNLVVNARDAMPRGGKITLDVDTIDLHDDPELRPGRYAVLAVEDDGVGIPPAVLPRIFEPFFTTKASGVGSGLGLATAHGIVAQSGGAILVSSAVGKGTTMRVLLPFADAPLSAPARDGHARGTILLVEDQAMVRAAVRTQLESAGYEVIEAEHGTAALVVLGDRSVDLVLSDISMPRMTGVELATELAASHPDVPILLMAGVVDSSAARLSLKVLPKPFTQAELWRAVSATIRQPAQD
jgi:two-component system cell cycle sensor histidine kinase/response regulator CckA